MASVPKHELSTSLWQIQLRPKGHPQAEWEPISVQLAQKLGDIWTQPFHHPTLEDAKHELRRLIGVERGLPNVIMRMATGRERVLDSHEIRFALIEHIVSFDEAFSEYQSTERK